MITSFDKRFPDADKLSDDLADVKFTGETAGSNDIIVEDDGANVMYPRLFTHNGAGDPGAVCVCVDCVTFYLPCA